MSKNDMFSNEKMTIINRFVGDWLNKILKEANESSSEELEIDPEKLISDAQNEFPTENMYRLMFAVGVIYSQYMTLLEEDTLERIDEK